MSASEHEFSESSSSGSPMPRESPYSSPSQQVPHLASAFSGITCGDDVTMHADGKRPYLRIIEQPQDHFRFRYKSEMVGTHGCLLGKTTAQNKTRTHPTVELVNYTGTAVIKVRLAHQDKDEEHPHKLLEDDEKEREVSTVVPQQGSYKVGFAGMGIIHTAKKNLASLLFNNYMNKMDKSKNISQKELRAYCENAAKTINLNIVRLRFSAHDINTDEEICFPVFSEPIHNMKSAATNDLKICRMSRHCGRSRGGDDVFILVEKVNKKNIVIRFYELNEEGDEVWSANGNFLQSDVHHQFAIVFRTPPYRDPQITHDVTVYMELMRPSDGRTSDRKEFVYKAEQVFKHNKRRRVNSNYSSMDSSSGGSIINDVPTTVEMIDQSERADAISNIPAFQINIPQIPVGQAQPTSDLADALLYGAGAPGMDNSAPPTLSPMLGAPNVPMPPVISLNSAELERLIRDDNDLADEERRQFTQTDWTEYMQAAFGDGLTDKTGSIGSMDFLRSSMQLVADSGKGKGVIKKEPVSPSKSAAEDRERRHLAERARHDGYSAFYKAEDGLEVKQLVREICDMMKTRAGYKKQDVRNKLERLFEMRLSNGDTFLHMTLASNQPSLEYMITLVHSLRMPHLLNLTNDLQQTILQLAVVHDQPRLVPFLVGKGCDPSMTDVEGNNAVHYAVVCGTCLKPLLEAIKRYDIHCGLNDYNNERQTALHLAAVYDSETSVRLLLEHGASYLARDAAGRTALHLALYDSCLNAALPLVQHTPSVSMLLEHGASYLARDAAGRTALHLALYDSCLNAALPLVQHTPSVSMLLEHGASYLARDAAGRTALHLALYDSCLNAALPLVQHTPSVSMLLEHGASYLARDAAGRTALHLALYDSCLNAALPLVQHTPSVSMLLEHGAGYLARDAAGRTALHLALYDSCLNAALPLVQHTPSVSMLLEHGAGYLARDAAGRTALHLALYDSCLNAALPLVQHTPSVSMLLEHGASYLARDAAGRTALHLALYDSCLNAALPLVQHTPSVSMLLEHGASYLARDAAGRTALHLALYDSCLNAALPLVQHTPSVSMLLEHGASYLARDAAGRTALHLALYDSCLNAALPLVQHTPSVSMLLEHGASYLARDAAGRTALHLALYDSCLNAALPLVQHTPSVSMLLEHGASYLARDAAGRTALHLALYDSCLNAALPLVQHTPSVSMLLEHGASYLARDAAGRTALHLALYDSCLNAALPLVQHTPSVSMLLEHGASYLARDAAGRTALHLALYDSCLNAALPLVQHTPSSDIDAVDGSGNTALQIICEKKNFCDKKLNIVKMLLDKKADPLKHENGGLSAWRLAQVVPALRAVFPPLGDDDVKSEPDDDFESADEGEPETGLAELPLYIGAVSALLDARGSWRQLATRLHADSLLSWGPWRQLATRLHADSLLSWYSNTASPAASRYSAALLDARGPWRQLATRLHADSLLSWYSNTASPAATLLHHVKVQCGATGR
ncbi:hypothetical protein O0L34_g4210 [Tuta absoluta]|nr:hypothetical protein O0L34_g4210 [Tuta absoluta]